MKVGDQVRVASVIRRLVARVNTLGDWKLNREADGRLLWNEKEMTRSSDTRVSVKSWGNYWGHKK